MGETFRFSILDYTILFREFPYLPEKNLDFFFFCNNPTEYPRCFRASRQIQKFSLFFCIFYDSKGEKS